MLKPKTRNENYSKWLVVRILDIIASENISIRSLAEKTGIGRMTLNRIIKEDRIISAEELSLIANGIGIEENRLTCKDTDYLVSELTSLIERRVLPQKTYALALELSIIAIGFIEKAEANRYLGIALEMLHRQEEATSYFERSLQLAVKSENREIIKICVNSYLNNAYTCKQYLSVCNAVSKYSDYFRDDSDALGRLHQFKGLCEHSVNNSVNAKKEFALSAKYFGDAGSSTERAIAFFNLGHMEFDEHNYSGACQYFEMAMSDIQSDIQAYLHLVIKHSQSHVALGNVEQAVKQIDDGLLNLKEKDLDEPKLHAKMLYMKAGINKDCDLAEEALKLNYKDKELKLSISNFLIRQYKENGDIESLMRTYNVMTTFMTDKIYSFEKI